MKKINSGIKARPRFSLLLAALVCVAAAGACKHKHAEESEALSATHPWRQDVIVNREYVAQVKAIQHIELRAFEKGYLTHIYVDEGRFIKKGQKMFQVMPMLVQAHYDKAKAEYEATEIEFENTEKLFKENVVSATELALVRARLKKNKAAMDLAKSHLDLATVSAPFSGIMDKFQVRRGSLVDEGALLTTMSDISKLWVYFNVSEKDYLNLAGKNKGKDDPIKVRFIMANGQEFKHTGIADTIEGEFDNETGTIPFRATFPNPERLLRHGETGNVIIREKLTHALVVPQKATYEVLDKRYLYKINAQGALAATEITVSHEVPHLFVIESGVTEDDLILLEGLGKVHDKEIVKTKIEPQEAVLKSFELAAH
ncbi:MAG: efflux RND transporter periplasmic adaptor subunit [Spirochaetes bacterium]|nr:efflux RND transporter periplasmic adaptor subunit [Spirochaetota bacterium]MBX3721290.1 efflux RND transporter periplasmic adaptor subunit [Turneriella sp.]